MPHDITNDQSKLAQVMAWCCQAPNHYLGQYWPRSVSLYVISRPQWVNSSQICQIYVLQVVPGIQLTRSQDLGVKISLRYIDPGVKISYDILTPGSIYRGVKISSHTCDHMIYFSRGQWVKQPTKRNWIVRTASFVNTYGLKSHTWNIKIYSDIMF